MICRETYYVIEHCTNNACSHSSKLQSTETNNCLPFTLTHSSILFQPLRPRIPISSRCELCLSACTLTVCVPMAVVSNDCRQRVVLTTGTPKSVASVYVSVDKFRSQWVRLVSQNCPVCLSLIDDRRVCTFWPSPHQPTWPLLSSLCLSCLDASHPSESFQKLKCC